MAAESSAVTLLLCLALSLSLLAAASASVREAAPDNRVTDIIDSSRGGLGLAEVARSVAARTASTSQVLSLNLTNLLILLVLKALLFGAGIFSFGLLGKHHPHGRAETAADTDPEAELVLALAFLSGEAGGSGHACLLRAACHAPDTALRYATAASALLSTAKAFPSMVDYNPRYERIVSGMKAAVNLGRSGGSCADQYRCSDK